MDGISKRLLPTLPRSSFYLVTIQIPYGLNSFKCKTFLAVVICMDHISKNIIKWTVPLISMALLVVLVSISAAGETYRTSFDRLFARSLGLRSFDLFTEAWPGAAGTDECHLWVGKMGYKHDFTHHLSVQYWGVGESWVLMVRATPDELYSGRWETRACS